ncbi:MarR family transcriptional regulator [Blastopirellula sp. JC732]|uniref:MarR family transcriptional regulator n=1 Tax=Blastopirellula sediminis TaxID=2894196 RepID=A0A9X1MTB4_9BACT|nr:MarR family transcriptional regulator [Blastopirellula sediminis]MCC9604599.1 MarR family transcriptional regulator [Blastopirellula sediminis]MCC9632102.1 MarR family transcriptional regulator [Blastopirellula sediminis]
MDPLEYDFQSSIGYWIGLTAHTMHQTLDERLMPFGITFRQFQVLGWLVHDREMTQAELAKRLMIEPPTLAGILCRMEAMGWIVRKTATNDRRRKLITVSPGAAPVWKQVVQCLMESRQEATAGMTREEIDQLQSLLKRVLHNLSRPASNPVLVLDAAITPQEQETS